MSASIARDFGQWENTDPAVHEWYQSLMRPDGPGICFMSASIARDFGKGKNRDPAVHEWYQSLMRPDGPGICCTEADAYFADEVHVRGGKTFATITDDRPDGPLGRPHIPNGTEFE